VITYKSVYKYTDTDYAGNDPNTDYADINSSGFKRDALKCKTCLTFKSNNFPEGYSMEYSPTVNQLSTLSFYAGRPKSEFTSNTYFYLYNNI
jgi:hypothetical protein